MLLTICRFALCLFVDVFVLRFSSFLFCFTSDCNTKLAQLLFASALQRRLNTESLQQQQHTSTVVQRKTVINVNPGAVTTEFINYFVPVWLAEAVQPFLLRTISKSPTAGIQTVVYAALSPELENVASVYIDNCHTSLASAQARRYDHSEQLWTVTEKMIGWKN